MYHFVVFLSVMSTVHVTCSNQTLFLCEPRHMISYNVPFCQV